MNEKDVVTVVAMVLAGVAVSITITLLGVWLISIALPISLTFWQWVCLVLGIRAVSFSPSSNGGIE